MATDVECSFWCPSDKQMKREAVTFDTTLGAKMVAIRNACQDHCRDRIYPGWVQPTDDGDKWLAFRMDGRNAQYHGHYPSQAAAEMWLIHRFA